jgi:hypothetical protein
VPAAAVIPAPIAYIKVVAVKKLVVGSQFKLIGPLASGYCLAEHFTELSLGALHRVSWAIGTFTLKKLECSKQAERLNNVAWNNGIGPRFYFVGFRNLR